MSSTTDTSSTPPPPPPSPSPSTPPPPLDDPSVSDPLACPPLRWGLIGGSRVCHDFCQALKLLPTASVVCCSARELSRAQEFAAKHGIAMDKAYGNYNDVLTDENVDIVYIGNVHAFRRSLVEQCLLANKHVLVEKPFACTANDAEVLINLAKKRNLFMLEGMWTRFFPAVEQARRLVFTEKAIGEVVSLVSDFHFNASDSDDPYPTSFFYNRKLGGGANLLVGPYPRAAATLFFGSVEPATILATGQVDKQTGVDLQAVVALSYPANKPGAVAPAVDDCNTTENTPKLPGAGIACCTFGMLGESDETTQIVGTKGRITIETPCHCPTRITATKKAQGRGQLAGVVTYHYPLPADTDEIIKTGGYVYPNSAGFCYEAAAVARCIAAGKTECPQYTLHETWIGMKMMDEIRKQMGVKTIYQD